GRFGGRLRPGVKACVCEAQLRAWLNDTRLCRVAGGNSPPGMWVSGPEKRPPVPAWAPLPKRGVSRARAGFIPRAAVRESGNNELIRDSLTSPRRFEACPRRFGACPGEGRGPGAGGRDPASFEPASGLLPVL